MGQEVLARSRCGRACDAGGCEGCGRIDPQGRAQSRAQSSRTAGQQTSVPSRPLLAHAQSVESPFQNGWAENTVALGRVGSCRSFGMCAYLQEQCVICTSSSCTRRSPRPSVVYLWCLRWAAFCMHSAAVQCSTIQYSAESRLSHTGQMRRTALDGGGRG